MIEIFGCRVDPSEVETALVRHPSVVQATVAGRENAAGQQELVAHVAVPGNDCTAEALRHHMTMVLPEHMVPRTVVVLPALPVAPDGRIDRDALASGPEEPPGPDRPDAEGSTGHLRDGAGPASRPPTGPRGPVELVLCELFGAALGTGAVTPQDDFFELGGHSMLAVRLASRVRAALGARVTVRDLFDAPTPRLLAAYLDGGERESHTGPCITLRSGDDGPALFLLPPVLGLSWSYAALLPHLDKRVPVRGLQTPGLFPGGQAQGCATLEEVADVYARRVRDVQPEGPYLLAGWSLGGLLAHAVAVRLQSRGHSVPTLALVDSYPLIRPPGERAEETRGRVLRSVLAGLPGESNTGDEGPAGDADRGALAVADGQAEVDAATVTKAVEDQLGLREAAELVGVACRLGELAHDFTPGRFDGPLVFFSAEAGRRPGLVPGLWEAHVTGGVRTHLVPGGHFAMMRSPAAEQIGTGLSLHLKDTGRID